MENCVESSMVPGLLRNDERKLLVIRARYSRAAEHLLMNGRKTVLDVGCSAGYGSALLHSKGLKVRGIDRNRNSIAIAKRMYPHVEFEVGDAVSYKKGRYDAVVALEVIEHLENYISALKNWFSMLKRDGIIVICTPNAMYSGKNIFHKKEFTYDELRVLFPSSTIEGFDPHYLTTKPVTILFGGTASLKFRMWLNRIARHFPRYCNNFIVVARNLSDEPF